MTSQRLPAPIRHLRRRQGDIDREAGLETVEILMWAALMVVAIVLIGGLLQALGADVVGFIRDQIGV
jgi:hypothetical protein